MFDLQQPPPGGLDHSQGRFPPHPQQPGPGGRGPALSQPQPQFDQWGQPIPPQHPQPQPQPLPQAQAQGQGQNQQFPPARGPFGGPLQPHQNPGQMQPQQPLQQGPYGADPRGVA